MKGADETSWHPCSVAPATALCPATRHTLAGVFVELCLRHRMSLQKGGDSDESESEGEEAGGAAAAEGADVAQASDELEPIEAMVVTKHKVRPVGLPFCLFTPFLFASCPAFWCPVAC